MALEPGHLQDFEAEPEQGSHNQDDTAVAANSALERGDPVHILAIDAPQIRAAYEDS
jgi:hypothetical protein